MVLSPKPQHGMSDADSGVGSDLDALAAFQRRYLIQTVFAAEIFGVEPPLIIERYPYMYGTDILIVDNDAVRIGPPDGGRERIDTHALSNAADAVQDFNKNYSFHDILSR